MRLVLGILVIALGAGCASDRYERAIKTGELLRSSHAEVVVARQQVVDTVALLDEMVTAPQDDLRPLYKQLEREFRGIAKASARAAKRTNAYRSHADAHVRAWAAELETMEDEEMREVGERHRAETKKRLEGIEKKALAVRQAYWPLLEELEGILQHLEQDLTAGGVAAIRPNVHQARKDAEVLEQCIDESLAELARVADLLDPAIP